MAVLLHERHGAVHILTLNRPENRNALNMELIAALEGALRDLCSDPGVRALIITGAGSAWCAGLDLNELVTDRPELLEPQGMIPAFRDLDVPVIAAINGACVTGALELALACDIRIGSEHAIFADTHAQLGVHPGWGLTAVLPRIVGPARAREMSFTGNYIDAQCAEAWGLVSRVVPQNQLIEEAIAMGGAIAGADQGVLKAIRALYDDDEANRKALERERAAFLKWRATFEPAATVASRREALLIRGRDRIAAIDARRSPSW
jgi:enoyl-CoA hydratase